ncbi:MAG TPA: amino acid adenylation domain-containing protein [Pyrinomonadaceae bacterium]|nr:amino acid adenylation domain-containing protein [Pyrinomonadaceae bacterium]
MSEVLEQVANLSPEQRDLLVLLLNKKKREASSRTRVSRSRDTDTFPLSFAQQRLWVLSQLQSDDSVYNMGGGVRMRGRLNNHALERALVEIVSRHEVLRTTFKQIDGEPVQVIGPPQALLLPSFSLESLPAAQAKAEAMMLARQEWRQGFDLEHGPLFRAKLLHLAAEEHILLLTMHHIIFDAWSMGVFVRELAVLYEAYASDNPTPFSTAPVQYVDFAVAEREWLQGEVFNQQSAYWRKKLSGAPSLLELPTDHPRPALQSFRGADYPVSISVEVAGRLKEICGQERATLFMGLLAVFKVLLYRYTNQPDLVVGVPVSGRNKPGFDEALGCFVNTLALRTELSGDMTFRELLAQVRDLTLEAFDHQDLPFEKLVEAAQATRDISYSPLFQVMFNLQNTAAMTPQLKYLELSPFEIDNGTAKFDLSLDLTETASGLAGLINYNLDLFDAATIQRMAGHFEQLLAAVTANPAQRISRLSLLTPAEAQLHAEWNRTDKVYSQPQCIHQIFEEQAALTPNAPALYFEGESLTYAELNTRANQLAHYLRSLGVGPDTLVGVSIEHSLEQIVALVGVLKAGAAYVPLEPTLPAARLSFMLADTAVPVVLTVQALAESLAGANVQVVCIDGVAEELAAQSASNPSTAVGRDNLAYVIYTSGSTGQPKGAMVHHRAACNRLLWAIKEYGFDSTDAILHQAPLSFDVSVSSTFTSLLSGARLVITRPGGNQDSAYLVKLIAEQRVTHMDFVPSMLQILLDEEGSERCDSLRIIISGAEALTAEMLDRFYARTDAQIANHYGPTETAMDLVSCVCDRDSERRVVPIGRPNANTQCYVLDQCGGQLPVGVSGELYLGGVQVGRGYVGRPELTAERFVPDPFGTVNGGRLYRTGDLVRRLADGTLEYLGRLDHQVKLRGHRIELGEIESALAAHPAIRNVVALIREDSPGDKRLVAYIAAEDKPTVTELRAFLHERLPDYMIPAVFVTLDELPFMPNGKVDRKALPVPDQSRPDLDRDFVAARTAAETVLTEIWSQVLGVEQVGIHDNFFELGGDSILSIQIINKASRAGLHFTPRQLFQHQTIAGLAAVAGINTVTEAEQGLVSGAVPLTPVQHWFFENNVVDPHHFNQALLLELTQPLEPALLQEAVEHLHHHHDALRLRFEQTEAGWQQRNAETVNDSGFSTVNFSELDEEDHAAAIEQIATTEQSSLNLATGPLLKVVLIDLGAERAGRLLLVAHHLVIDGLSWRILLEDLHRAYLQLKRGQDIDLGTKTSSFKQWGEGLRQYAASGKLDANYWLDAKRRSIAPLPRDKSGPNTVATARTVTVNLTREETRALVQKVPAAYHTQINDALLTALAQAFKRWSGRRHLLVDLEGHGREDLMMELNLSRTVGWFTGIYPVLLEVPEGASAEDGLKSIKEQLRAVPQNGISYGLLRYLGDEETKARLRTFPAAEVLFNYFGQLDQVLSELPMFAMGQESTGPSQSLRGARPHLIEINGSIIEGQLQMSWSYSENVHHRETIERVAGAFIDALRNLITHCESEEAGGFTPSDFPLARLDQRKLGKLSALINKKDKSESLSA